MKQLIPVLFVRRTHISRWKPGSPTELFKIGIESINAHFHLL